MTSPLVTYTEPYPLTGWIDEDPVTHVSPTPINQEALKNITDALAAQASAINYLATQFAAVGGGPVSLTDNGDGSVTIATGTGATATVSKPVSNTTVRAALDARYEQLVSTATGQAHLISALVLLGVWASVTEAGGVYPALGVAYPGKLVFVGADTPATGGTTARTNNKAATSDAWLHTP